MPQPPGRRTKRRLFRWHPATSTRTGLSFAAVAIALAIVGASIFETGILARTPDGTLSPDARDRAAAYPFEAAAASVSGHDPDARNPVSHGGHTPELVDTAPADGLQQGSGSAVASPASGSAAAIAESAPGLTGAGFAYPVYSFTILQDPPLLDRIAAAGAQGARSDPATRPAPTRPAAIPIPPARSSRPATPARQQSIWNVAPIVTWYGPGFYGKRTACGYRYTRKIIGVAHKTLPCGTLVQFRWHGITAVARVIDRGPYATSDYVFDFSAALACDVFRPHGARNGCFTRNDVQWRVIGWRQN